MKELLEKLVYKDCKRAIDKALATPLFEVTTEQIRTCIKNTKFSSNLFNVEVGRHPDLDNSIIVDVSISFDNFLTLLAIDQPFAEWFATQALMSTEHAETT